MSTTGTTLSKFGLLFFSALPLKVSHALGATFGRMVNLFPNRQSKLIRRNLELCFPEQTLAQRNTLIRQNMSETGKNITELGAFWRWPEQRIKNLVVEEVDRQILDHAIAANKGVIVTAPHTGAWELIGLRLTCDQPMHFLYRPNKKPHRDETFIKARERFGGRCHPITPRGLAALVKALKGGALIGILPDQEPAMEHGVFAPFYDVPAYTMTFLSGLARRTGAPVVFAAMERLSGGRGYRLHYLQPDNAIYSEDALESATALNHCVERCINLAPSQYMWNYRRFRKTPPDSEYRY